MNKGERTRQQILNQGMKYSGQYGLSEVTIGTVSALCGLSRTGVISHFKNKEDMQIAILEYSEAQFLEHVLKPARRPDPLEQLTALFDLWQNWTERVFEQGQISCPLVKALVEYQHRPDSAVRRFAIGQQQRLLDYLVRLIHKGVSQGALKADTPCEALAYELFILNLGHTVTQSAAPFEGARAHFEAAVQARLNQHRAVQ
ncbi:TetR/AcrR family transcriptional regulator [Ferrimonas balearica]|uniref:TetR/AcrR family transcriptional regulator n=1 Tax=Ferrimonas balearica TaxID=44012 RepID=UPI001C9927A4|nr:TetR/AcrR family transcriptional regulator [Ferrimonas balearica]MBY5990948.1 TetR/AcrR family transcriptional regulator [Ferrimonas balearica]